MNALRQHPRVHIIISAIVDGANLRHLVYGAIYIRNSGNGGGAQAWAKEVDGPTSLGALTRSIGKIVKVAPLVKVKIMAFVIIAMRDSGVAQDLRHAALVQQEHIAARDLHTVALAWQDTTAPKDLRPVVIAQQERTAVMKDLRHAALAHQEHIAARDHCLAAIAPRGKFQTTVSLAATHAESENTQAQAQLNALVVLLGRSLLTKLQATSLWHV